MLRCYAKARRAGVDPATDRRILRCVRKAEDRFYGRRPGTGCFERLEAREDPAKPETICGANGDAAEVAATVEAFVESMVARLGPHKVAFVTSARYDADLGGLAGADAICESHAWVAHLPGTYKAWLSDAHASPATRFVQADVPYVRTDGIVIANHWTDLTGSGAMLRNPLQMDENGRVEITAVWTNTRPDGTTDDPNLTCDSWMSATPGDLVSIGETFVTPISNWSRAESLEFCSSRLNLYCFQQ